VLYGTFERSKIGLLYAGEKQDQGLALTSPEKAP